MIPFGKYKGQSIDVFMKDTEYVKWCKQNGILEKYNIKIPDTQIGQQSRQDVIDSIVEGRTKILYVLSLQQGKYYVGTTENFSNIIL